jgi:hypothetical protein
MARFWVNAPTHDSTDLILYLLLRIAAYLISSAKTATKLWHYLHCNSTHKVPLFSLQTILVFLYPTKTNSVTKKVDIIKSWCFNPFNLLHPCMLWISIWYKLCFSHKVKHLSRQKLQNFVILVSFLLSSYF